MLLQGLMLAIVGMSVVFIFLMLLVFAMKLLSAFIPKYFPDGVKDINSSKKQINSIQQKLIEPSAQVVGMGDTEIAAVIAAVKSYSHS